MMNYIKADLSRIFKRIPRMILLLITFAAFCVAIHVSVLMNNLFAEPMFAELGLVGVPDFVFGAIVQVVGYAAGAIGLFELIYVFSDDFRAKTAQIAIGVGVSRVKVIFSKLFELMFLLFVDMMILLGLSIMMSAVLGSTMSGAQILEMVGVLAMDMLVINIAYSSLVFVLLFSTQSMTLAVLGFLALRFHLVSGMIGLTEYIKVLRPLNLGSYTLTAMLDKVAGAAALTPILAIAAYVGGFLLITNLIYRKKELEF